MKYYAPAAPGYMTSLPKKVHDDTDRIINEFLEYKQMVEQQ